MRYCAWFVSWYSSTSRWRKRSCQLVAHLGEPLEQLDGPHQEVVEVHRVGLVQPALVAGGRRRPRLRRRSVPACSRELRPAPTSRFFSAEMRGVDPARREALRVAVERPRGTP